MKIRIGICVFFALWNIFSANGLHAQNTSLQDSLFNITLPTADGKQLSLREMSKSKATILVMLSPECPICAIYTHTLHLFNLDFKKQGVEIYLVFPGKYFDLPTIKTYLKDHLLEYPTLLDENYQLTKLLKAAVTPEAFVIDSTGEVVYSGMIDNWYYALGKKRGVRTEFYVKDAVNAELAGHPVKLKRKEPIGCPIYGLKD